MVDEFISTAPKPFVLVLMPFKTEFYDIYKFGIKGAAEKAGAYAERLDEQIFDEIILERLYNQINKADVIVADMTERNANVFYEVGYAHALGKLVLLLTKNAEDIPFDLKHHQHIVYGGSIDKLQDQLLDRLIWAISESKKRASGYSSENISLYLNGLEIPQGYSESNLVHINVPYSAMQSHGVLEVTLSNIGSVGINDPLRMYLITERQELHLSYPHINTPKNHRIYGEKTKMFDLGMFPDMYPGAVEEHQFEYRVRPIRPKPDEFQCQIMINSNSKKYSFPFILEMR
jgi:hypothetical protein